MLSKKLALMTWQVIPGHVADTWKRSARVSTRRHIRSSVSLSYPRPVWSMVPVQGDIYGKIFMNPEFISYNLLDIRLFREEYL